MASRTLAEHICRARERKGFSQRKAAERIGISHIHLNRIENDHANPSVTVLLKIAKGLDTTAAELLEGVES